MKKQTQNKMRMLSAVLALVMVLSTLVVFPMTANAETESFHEVWDGSKKTPPKGEGTEAEPYLIANGENLAWMADNIPQNPATPIYYKQTADIDLGGHDFKVIGWQFVDKGDNAAAFYGNYNGCGFKISNAKIAQYKSHGLYYGADSVAAMAYFYGNSGVNTYGLFGAIHESTIENVHLVNIQVGDYNPEKTSVAEVYSTNYAGALVGAARNSTIKNCSVDSTSRVYGGWAAGGIVGLARTNVTVIGCTNYATVIADLYAGGIIGRGHGLNVSYCVNNGKIMVDNRGHAGYNIYAGGICGTIDSTVPADFDEIVETFEYCLNGENAQIWSTSTQNDYISRQGGILGMQKEANAGVNVANHKYLFSHCYNLATNTTENPAPFKSTQPTGNSKRVQQGAICAQVVVNKDNATMEYCQSVALNRIIVEGDINKTTDFISNESIKLNSTYALAGLVNANGDAGGENYWNNTQISTNKYGETAANIKASADYQAIISATNYTPGVTVPETNGVVYRGHQRSSALTDSTYDIRLVATVDSLDYEEVGFKFSISGTGIEVTDQQFSCTKVYSSLTGKDDGITKTYTAEALGGTYLMALALEGFTADMGQITVTVTPYWIEAGETDATLGTSYQVVYNAAGELVTQKKA